MIVAIIGSRDWTDRERVREFVWKLSQKYPSVIIVSGGARGVDTMAFNYAGYYRLETIVYKPYELEAMEGGKLFSIETETWGDRAQEVVVTKHRRINPPCFKSYGQAAFFRNGWIVDDADQVVAFHDGSSRGTADSIARAERAGKPVHVYGP